MGRSEEQLDQANKKKDEMKLRPDNGIEWDRSCTDMPCFILFIAFIVVMIGCAGYGFGSGDPYKLATPYDQLGRECGKGALKDYKYKWQYAILQASKDPRMLYKSACVKECPKQGKQADCYGNDICRNNNTAWYALKGVSPIDTSTEFISTYCLPTGEALEKVVKMIYKEVNSHGTFGKYIGDLQNGWKPIAIMSAGSFLVAFLYTFILKWIVKPVLYLSMVLILLVFIALGAWCFQTMGEFQKGTDEYNYNMAGAIVFLSIAAIYLCFMCCCWKNISLGASIMECASVFVTKNVRILALPVIAYFLSIVVFLIWMYSAVYIWCVGDAEYRPGQVLANIKWEKQTEYIMWGYLFGLLWIVAFIICMQQFVIACLTCMWYFSGQGAEMSDAPGEVSVLKAIWWGAWYHMGSVAFGSFCIAVITMIRIVFEYLAKKYEAIAGKDNPVYKCITCCMRCVLWCLDAYVKFITKNAFIQIALNNMNFCSAAWESFYLVIRHAGRFASAGWIGFIMMLLGKGTIMGISALLTFIITKYKFKLVQQPLVPSIFVFFFSYLVGSLFMSIFSFSCTAILHCFISDEDAGEHHGRVPESLTPFLAHVDRKNEKAKQRAESYKDAKPQNMD